MIFFLLREKPLKMVAGYLECSFYKPGTLCHSPHRSPAQRCGSGNQNGVLAEAAASLSDNVNKF